MSQCCAALLNLLFLDSSSHYALACSRKFGDLLMNDTEAPIKILRDYGVSTIVCGRFLNYKYVEKLVHIIQDEIQVYLGGHVILIFQMTMSKQGMDLMVW